MILRTNRYLVPLTGVIALFCCAGHSTAAGLFDTTVTLGEVVASAPVSPMIYGQYLEHVQADEQTIYPSIWDAASPKADSRGVRADVSLATRALGTPIIRWPGGCFADVYHWEDGIGPRSQRQPKPNRHWKGTESNLFGTDEFLHFVDQAETAAYINVNLGSGSLPEALRWLEYCNGTTATVQGLRRAENGRQAPYDVTYWGIGNETYGEWEMGHTDAATYGTSLSLWARAMKKADPQIKVLGVGSEEGNNPDWDNTVLTKAGEDIDLLTVHMYGVSTSYDGSEYQRFVFTPAYLENRLARLIKRVDQATSHPVDLSVDEWNIRHFYNGQQNRKSPRNLQDALFTASFFNAMIRHSPRVAMANYVFLVNGNGTLLVRDQQIVWTPLAYLFQVYSQWMNGHRCEVSVEGPVTNPPQPLTGHPEMKMPTDYTPAPLPWVDAVATRNEKGEQVVALVNRHQTDPARVAILNKSKSPQTISRTWTLHHNDIYATNNYEAPERITPVQTKEAGKSNFWICPPHSITLLMLN